MEKILEYIQNLLDSFYKVAYIMLANWGILNLAPPYG